MTREELSCFLEEHFGNNRYNLDNLDSMEWVSLIAALSKQGVEIEFALLPSVDSIYSLHKAIKK